MEKDCDLFFHAILGPLCPGPCRNEFDAIVEKKELTWQTRTRQIEDLFIKYYKEDPQYFPCFNSAERMSLWIKRQSEKLAEHLKKKDYDLDESR